MKRTIAAAVATAIGLILLAAPSVRAQGTINAIGKVVDAQGNPVPDVKVLLDYKGHIVQKYRTKTDKNGVFTHVRVYSGPYRITLTKDGVGEVSFNASLQEVDSLQKPPEYKFVPKTADGRAAAARLRPRSGRRAARGGSRRHGPAHERDQQRDRALQERRHRRGDRRVRGDPREDAADPARAPQPRDALQEEGRRGPGPGRDAEVGRARPPLRGRLRRSRDPARRVGQAGGGDRGRPEGDDREPAERAAPVRARRARRGLAGRRRSPRRPS